MKNHRVHAWRKDVYRGKSRFHTTNRFLDELWHRFPMFNLARSLSKKQLGGICCFFCHIHSYKTFGDFHSMRPLYIFFIACLLSDENLLGCRAELRCTQQWLRCTLKGLRCTQRDALHPKDLRCTLKRNLHKYDRGRPLDFHLCPSSSTDSSGMFSVYLWNSLC